MNLWRNPQRQFTRIGPLRWLPDFFAYFQIVIYGVMKCGFQFFNGAAMKANNISNPDNVYNIDFIYRVVFDFCGIILVSLLRDNAALLSQGGADENRRVAHSKIKVTREPLPSIIWHSRATSKDSMLRRHFPVLSPP